MDLLTTYHTQLDRLAAALLHEETLDAARIQEILAPIPAAVAEPDPFDGARQAAAPLAVG